MDNVRKGWLAAQALLVTLALCLGPPALAQTEEPIYDPIPEQPIQSGLGLVLEEFASFPRSETYPSPPTDVRLMRHARINYLGEVPDGSGRLYVPDLNGKLYFLTKQDRTPHVYLDVQAVFAPAFYSRSGLGQGFGFVAFHPDFEKNGKFYTVHTEDAGLATSEPDLTPQPNTVFHGVVTEWTATDPKADTFSGTRREVLRIGFGSGVHGIQQIDFNPTAKPKDEDYGLLYLAVGDGGRGAGGTDPQNLTMPQGKILRIDPLGHNSENGQYGIPATNPFVGKPGVLGEIYAIGVRDPHRFSWDTGPGHRMFLGHIGEHAIEAIYEVRPGANFGWSEREGAFVFDRAASDPCDRLYPLPPDDKQYGYTYPVAAYDHDPPPTWDCRSDVGRAVVGGFVYRGREVPALRGKYVFGDIVDGRLFYTEAAKMRTGTKHLAPLYQLVVYDKATGRQVPIQALTGVGAPGDPNRVDLRFGRDADGELYVLAKSNGKIWKVVDTRGFASGDVGDTTVSDVMAADNWSPITPEKWQFPGDQVILAEPGTERPGPRRPFEYAVLTEGPQWESVEITAEVRIDTPVEITNRDVIIVLGHRSDTEFSYVHLSTDNSIYAHNGIFVVDNADRERIEHQWNGYHGAPPAIVDTKWHKVRVVHFPATGEIAVYVDGSKYPLMTATDPRIGVGRVGFGSFDNIGRIRNLKVTGTPASSQ